MRDGASSRPHAGTWAGRGAARLGLEGRVGEEALRRLLDGRHPATGDPLAADPGHRRTTGCYDFTFAAPKSVSLAAFVGGDARILEAHRNAVDNAFAVIEAFAAGRAGQNGVRTGNLVAAQFTHGVSRALDPHLHTHCVVANLTRTDSGWRALRDREMFRLQRLGTKAYRAALANQLELLGYEVAVGRDRAVEIAAVTRGQIEHFATRHREIVEHRARAGAWSAAADRIAQASTRVAKRAIDEAELVSSWEAAAVECGLDGERLVAEALDRAPSVARLTEGEAHERARERAREVRSAIDIAVATRIESDSVTTEADLVETCLDAFFGRFFPQEVLDAIAGMRRDGDILELVGDVSKSHAQAGRLTTPELLAMEREVAGWMLEGRGACRPVAATASIAPGPAPDSARLNDEQARAAFGLLHSTDRICGVQGFAGVGKTFMLKRVIREAERAGHTIVCIAPYTAHVAALESEGIEARTVASHLMGDPRPAPGQIWIVDEAGTLDTVLMHSVLSAARRASARVILLGDERQHQAVAAGAPFRLLRRTGMQIEQMADIQRQKVEQLRQAVREAARGLLPEAIRRLKGIGHDDALRDPEGRLLDADLRAIPESGTALAAARPLAPVAYIGESGETVGMRQGSVVEIRNPAARCRAIAREYCRYADDPKSVLAIAPTNRERVEINEAVRQMLREAGKIGTTEVTAQVLRNSGVSSAARKLAINYHAGQRVFYSKKSRRYGVGSKSFGTVVTANRRDNTVTVRLDSGREITYDPREYYGVTIYDVESRSFAVGDRIQYRAPDDSASHRVPNGALGRITAIDANGVATIALDSGGETGAPSTIDLSRSVQIDHGYAVTSYSSQGKTVDRVLVSVDATNGAASLVNRELGYVAMSRARFEATIFTDDGERLETALERHREKVNVHDFVGVRRGGSVDYIHQVPHSGAEPPERTIQAR